MSETIEVLSAVHGIAPRSEELLRLGTNFEKGRASWDEFDTLRHAETDAWWSVQEEAGIDIREDGRLWWPDHLRNIVKGSTGFAPDVDNAPVTRWFEDNRFYRRPTIIDRLHFDENAFELTTLAIRSIGPNVSLLAPSTFASLCDDKYSELPANRNMLQLYSELLFSFEQDGVERVTFEDYSDGEICSTGKNHALADVETLAEWCPNIQFSFINPLNNATAIPWRLKPNLGVQIPPADIPLIAREPEYRRPDLSGGEIWHNVIDSGTTAPDQLETASISLETLQNFGVARLVLTHSVDLEHLPLSYAQDKVKRLGEFTVRLKELL